MSLEIVFREEIDSLDNSVLINDVEKEFATICLTGSKEELDILEYVEKAKFDSPYSFIDRFGYKLSTSLLSTGSKSALVVLHNPDKIVDLLECGYNARDAIINFCSNGTIIISDSSITIVKLREKVDIILDGYKFTDINELNYYINDVRPFDYTPRT